MVRNAVLACLMGLLSGSSICAQEWAEEMFKTRSHDFGTIARGSKAEYEFVFTNIYLEDVHVASAYPSCRCTSVTIKKPLLKTYEEGAIVARINSDTFLGRQAATITVTIDRPQFAQVRLPVKVYVQSDIVLQPAGINLGTVQHRTPAEKTLSVTCTRRSDWQVLDVKSDNPHLSGEVTETGREGNRVSYQFRARLAKDAPPGHLKEYLILVTNDPVSAQIAVLVEGRVVRDVTVSPATLFLGVVRPGEKVTKKIVVRGNKPFRITSVTAECKCFQATTSPDGPAKLLHLVPVTFTARDEPGTIVKTIRIKTDMDDTSADLSAYAVVAAKE